MRRRKRKLLRLIYGILPILFCLAALWARCFRPHWPERLQEAVFGMPPQRIEAVFSELRQHGAEEVFFLED